MNDPLAGYLLFAAGGRRYALAVETVGEIAEVLPVSPLPGSPPFLLGAANVHGKIVAVVDLSNHLGTGKTSQGRNLLLLNMPDTALALLVEQPGRIIHEDEILAVDPAAEDLAVATLNLADGNALLLSAERLLASIEQSLA
jgi:chemotaxis signal transduction protein